MKQFTLRRGTIAGMALAALMLAGCSATPAPPSATSASSTETATPSPTPTPTPDAPDYGFTFYKEAQLASSEAEMAAALGYPVTGPAECPTYLRLDNTDPVLTWYFTDELGHGFDVFYTQAYPGITDYPRNLEGVGIGSTQAELLAAYPSAVVGLVNDLGAGDITTVTVDDPDTVSQYVFGFTAGSTTVDLLQWGLQAGYQWSHLCGGF